MGIGLDITQHAFFLTRFSKQAHNLLCMKVAAILAGTQKLPQRGNFCSTLLLALA
jgi:hypothetical protein